MRQFINFLLIAITIGFFTSCATPQNEVVFTLKNNADIDKTDAGVILSRKVLSKEMKQWATDNEPAIFYDNTMIPFQLDDLDNDGEWDQLFFVINIPAGASKKIIVRETQKENIPDFKQRTNIRFADVNPPYKELATAKRLSSTDTKISQKYFQMEGPAWENEHVGFRNYFDARNGIDIYGKRVSEMILEKVGINGQNYHELDDWGMDILSVGTSLGAGAIALEIQDSLYRIDYSEKATINIITEGPLRSIFELNFPQWEAANRVYDVKHVISIQAGKRYYQSEVSVSGLKGDENLVAGLVNIHNETLFTSSNSGTFSSLSTHAQQAYDKEYLGMALLLKTTDLVGTGIAPEEGDGIIQSHLIKIKIEKDQPTLFRSYACWELEEPKFNDRAYFLKFLEDEAKEMSAPLEVDFGSE